MKRLFVTTLTGFSTLALLTGCLGLQLGGGTTKTEGPRPTTGQQLVDLKKAKDCGAITDAEYQTQKAKLLYDK